MLASSFLAFQGASVLKNPLRPFGASAAFLLALRERRRRKILSAEGWLWPFGGNSLIPTEANCG